MDSQNRNSLKHRTIKGVIWSAFDSISGLAVQMICSLVVARLLTPKDFGIVGMIAVFSAIGLIIIDSGYGQALIRKQDATQDDYKSVFCFNLLLSVVVYAILFILSPLIESFYKIDELCLISRVVFLIIPLNAIGLIQNTILTKKVDFKKLGIVSFISALISGIIGIILAYTLKNVWAIVYQTVSMYLFRTLLLWIIAKWRPSGNFSLSSIKSMTPYASNLLFTGLFGTIVNNICPLIIGKVYNATQLGYFTQADKIQKLPSSTATSIIQRVTFPVLVEIQDDNMRLQQAYFKILSQAVYLISPVMILLIVIGPELFNLLLGPKWDTAAYYFQILCISGLLYPISCLSLNLINIKGNSKLLFKLEVVRKVMFVITIFISMRFSIDFFVWMQAAYSLSQLFLNLYFSGKQIDLSLITQFRVIFPLLLISIVCCVPEVLISHTIDLPQYIEMTLNILFYSFIYICASKLLKLTPFEETVSIIKKFIKCN